MPNKHLYDGKLYTMHSHPLYSTWKSMNDRCYRKYNYTLGDYVGRVKVCDRWLRPCFGGTDPNAFQNFCDDMGVKPTNTTLDRIDPRGDYSPENCRWAGIDIQAHNKRGTKNCIAVKYNYRIDKYGNKVKDTYYRISIKHNGKYYNQHIKKGETPAHAFSRLREKTGHRLDDWTPPDILLG